jgi:soluble lytic murein transglycosylase-like protein
MLAGFTVVAQPASGADQPQRFSSVVRPDLRTGKLVRSVVVIPKPVSEQKVPETVVRARAVSASEPGGEAPAGAAGINEAVEQIALEHALPPELIHSVIKVESNYNPYAVSNKGALGIMQLIPGTAQRFGVTNVFNPLDNIRGGAKYLRYLLDLYRGDYPLALAAYNAGEAAVAKYGGMPPFTETQHYVMQVRKRLEAARRSAAPKPVAAAPKPAEPRQDGPAHIVEERQPDGSVRYVSR